ncbi:hypothetical protein CAI21_10445 [Alkalilimnicola ehrlichii]|uniref:Protein kinase domain-containing protein n=1 Tax=Alkalilimnicola ehrlichii TaxID=351052 RepID=A0A3E0WV97_9GAMM|nr:hypothetical protein [Alkalilimnicola ehrlichii]RFA29179.1 hypothetical protein CAI21_10445 [Alkalilimnicola ehrlichii]RFA36091.1 hypothetical protein CAL65_11590 [Alkalilimnicola ehrlichii]
MFKGPLKRVASGDGLIVLGTLIGLLFAGLVPGVRALDAHLYRFAETLFEPASVSAPVVVAHTGRSGESSWEERLTHVAAWLDRARSATQSAAAVAWVLDEHTRNALIWSPEGQALRQRLDDAGVLLGVPAEDFAGLAIASWPAKAARNVEPGEGQTPLAKASILNPVYREARLIDSEITRFEALPVLEAQALAVTRPLLWHVNERIVPDLALQVYARTGGHIEFAEGGLRAGGVFIPTDRFGRIYPRYSTAVERFPSVREVDIRDLGSRQGGPSLSGQIIILGAADDPIVRDLAASVVSLYAPALTYTPGWAVTAEKALLLLFALYLLFVLPFLRAPVAALLTLILVLVSLGGMMGVYASHGQWVSLAAPLLLLTGGYAIAQITNTLRRHRRHLTREADAARVALARRQLEDADLEAALARIESCETSDAVLDVLYDIGIGYERRRHYEQAAKVFQTILRRRRKYRDTSARIAKLSQLHATSAWQPGQTYGAASMLIPEEGLARPVLGRYELERELGRGSMGVVYLGVDPKIGRPVAVKTLDLTSLDEDPDEFRARFSGKQKRPGDSVTPIL